MKKKIIVEYGASGSFTIRITIKSFLAEDKVTPNLNNNFLHVLMKIVTFDPHCYQVLRDKDSWSRYH